MTSRDAISALLQPLRQQSRAPRPPGRTARRVAGGAASAPGVRRRRARRAPRPGRECRGCLVQQVLRRLVRRQRRPVRSGLGQGPVGVGGGEDAGRHRQVVRGATRGGSRCRRVVRDAGRRAARAGRARSTRRGCVPSGTGAGAPVPTPLRSAGRACPTRRWRRRPGRRRASSPATSRSCVVASGSRSCSAAPPASAATAREWPSQYGLLRSTRSPKTSATARRSGAMTYGCGSVVEHRVTGIGPGEVGEPLGCPSREVGRELRIEHAAPAATDRLDGEVGAADRLEEDGDAGQPRDPGADRDVVAVRPPALAPPQVEHVEQADLDVLGQLQSPGRLPTHLARGGGEPVAPAAALRERGEREPRPFDGRPAPASGWAGTSRTGRSGRRCRCGRPPCWRPVRRRTAGRSRGRRRHSRRGAAARCRTPPGRRPPAGRGIGRAGSRGRTTAAPHPPAARSPGRRSATARPEGRPAAPRPRPRV